MELKQVGLKFINAVVPLAPLVITMNNS